VCAARLASLGRLDLLKTVAGLCQEIQIAATKTVSVTVASAVELSAAQKDRILKAIPKYTNGGNFKAEFQVCTPVQIRLRWLRWWC
jgi:F0F1-type ATP synthase delta subunit